MSKNYITKDSGKRQEFNTGMKRDSQEGKPRFDLCIAKDLKFDESLFYRWAMLMGRGAEKYDERNWEKANTEEEMSRFKASAFRHFMQWFSNEEDEDHAAAVLFNINAHEYVKTKIK